MIIILEHCNGEIMEDPFILKDWSKIKDYIDGPYLIYFIDYFHDTIRRVQ